MADSTTGNNNALADGPAPAPDEESNMLSNGQIPGSVAETEDSSQLIADPHNSIDGKLSKTQARLDKMRGAVRTLLECIGENPDRDGLRDTPLRFAKALLDLTKGYEYQDDVEAVVNRALFQEGHHETIVVRDIAFHSLCEHHLLPFTGKMHICYIPWGTVIGLSKLVRIANMYSQRLQIQERLTKEVAKAIVEVLNPRGVVVVVEARHMCMELRGVEKVGSSTITISALGCFKEDVKTPSDFFRIAEIGRS